MDGTGTATAVQAELETVHGRPCSLRWADRVWRVTDAPTRIEDVLGAPPTHPLPISGWRFQGTSTADGETLVFDVVRRGAGWQVVHTYR